MWVPGLKPRDYDKMSVGRSDKVKIVLALRAVQDGEREVFTALSR